MRTKLLGVLSLISLAVTILWLVFRIMGLAAAGPLDTFEQVLAYVNKLDVVFYLTYANAALITVSAVMLFAALYLYYKPVAPEWSALGAAFVPIYGAMNLIVYLSQVTVVPRLLQYAVEILNIKHIIVCGHYGCGGIKATFENQSHGLIDNWLRHIRDIQQRRSGELLRFSTVEEKVNRLCELNVIEQVKNVGNTTIVQKAWQKNQKVTIHGWIYAISDGLLKDLDACVSSIDDLARLENL